MRPSPKRALAQCTLARIEGGDHRRPSIFAKFTCLGIELNGKYGVVRGGAATANGRVALEIFSGYKGDEVHPEKFKPPVSVKLSNLDRIDPESVGRLVYRMLEMYLYNKAISILKNEGNCERAFQARAEMFAIPGFSPSIGQPADIAAMLRSVGRFVAIVMGQICLSETSRSSPGRWKTRYEVGFSLAEVGRLDEAFRTKGVMLTPPNGWRPK